jgi:hypothetical protein
MRVGSCRIATACYFLALLLATSSRAQTFTGTIVGRVLDAQRAGVAGARLTLRSVEREFQRYVTANIDGEYAFDLVAPGRYTVEVHATGFAPASRDVEVVVATPVRVDVTLGLEGLREEVKVVGESGVSVQTENANLGLTISPHEMSELPSLTRSPYDFAILVPGAVFSNDAIGVGVAINGGRTQSANYLLDGAENNEAFMSTVALDVPLDSIEEFNVQTNHYSAEYGRNSAFVANVITKAGTKSFHASLYDYFRNSALAANTFDNNAHDLPRPVFNRHQFGGSLGGPIRRSKLFFFGSIEPVVVRSEAPTTFYVPTPQLLSASSPGTQAIFRRYPVPAQISSSDVINVKVCPYSSVCDRQSGAGLVSLAAFAFTSRSGPQDAGAGVPQNTILATGRVDWIVNSKTQTFVRYGIEDKRELAFVTQPYSRTLDLPQTARNQNVVMNVIRTWSATFATETRFVYSRIFGDPDRFSGSNALTPNPPFPFFSIENEPRVTLPSGTESFGGPENVYQIFHTLTEVHGQHTVKAGGQYIHLRDNRSYGIGQTATATFTDAQAFVDGVIGEYSIALDPKNHFPGELVVPPFGPPSFTRHYRYNEPAFFIADTWKVTRRLTVTPGLRWEYFGVFHSPGSEKSLDSNFYPGMGASELERIARGRFLRTTDASGDLRGHFYRPDYNNFAPRLGIAYDVFGDGKTVFRAGGGIFYDRRVGWELFRAILNPPAYSLALLSDVPLTPEILNNQFAAFPNAPVQLNKSVTQDPATEMRTAYIASWNATVEHEFLKALVFGASYLGSSGNRLYSISNVNRIGSRGLLDSSCVTTRFGADGVTPIGPDYTNCSRLNPALANIAIRGNEGHSSFHALELRLNSRRLTTWGLEFGVNYTWNHSIDNRSVSGLSSSLAETGRGYLNAFDPSLDRGDSDFDVRHHVAAYYIWEIPLGRRAGNRIARQLLGGWGISGILSYQTGQPFTIADSGVPDLTFGNPERTRARIIGPLPHARPLVADSTSPNTFLYLPINSVYDSTTGLCIADAAPFGCQISVNGPFDGTLGRNVLRQPGLYFQNTAFIKNVRFSKERFTMQFRAELYNVFNHPNLYLNPGAADVNTRSFTGTAGTPSPGATASFKDNRQIVLALRLLI